MPETAQASRGKQAKARIRQAFTKLLREKPIQRIAVKEALPGGRGEPQHLLPPTTRTSTTC